MPLFRQIVVFVTHENTTQIRAAQAQLTCCKPPTSHKLQLLTSLESWAIHKEVTFTNSDELGMKILALMKYLFRALQNLLLSGFADEAKNPISWVTRLIRLWAHLNPK
ncbi:hypothetical protein SNK03_012727 [Fusarium graminearum]|uniref:Chromosome 3, complete genome n=1 Tax=Gibberella zeae (strain ATCC MYA-4620 / CBS 123657 / FGSC 9075 / NRRL 31084 / PH-1) TaxID=229533 RepID=I1SAL3_GIBZE|nr:hypothetical protein FGSG_13894 [Fusarium graminearum PH-1]ESU17867.1 hypothetical protein FGSG_13894 [Fusarium graminearum PH-1]CEF86654.1 unnamed protein product [Fusarium graminearum]CZS85464.1 unnamed protein product [Fusarium graminearum]|eukprot:XP_011325489.1 hypothetical protein FGSG_13894 [Fusarium graminearum PH-1]